MLENADPRHQPDLTRDEREILLGGIAQWDGPARLTDAVALVMGFVGRDEAKARAEELMTAIRSSTPLSRADWTRVLISTEIMFASDVLGAGVEWSIVTGFRDDETIRSLRLIQRKLIHFHEDV